MLKPPKIFLSDNGSLRPEATLQLRCLADALTNRLGLPVDPVSVLHSYKVDPALLGGKKARIFNPSMRRAVADGHREIIVLPLFLGPSQAITKYLPELIEVAREDTPELQVLIAEPLAGTSVEAPDPRLAQILADNVRKTMAAEQLERPKVAVVDHGTPIRPVNALRNAVAGQVEELLGDSVTGVVPCSMERREGPEYAFNDPLLENLDSLDGFAGGDLVAAMFFLLPGRHAGAGGDVAEIAEEASQCGGFDRIQMTELMTTHPLLLEILLDRANEALAKLA
ncbi:MAG: CbiX/SirB N-terminal domain-containing protein [Verrucomicrobiota bacterium]